VLVSAPVADLRDEGARGNVINAVLPMRRLQRLLVIPATILIAACAASTSPTAGGATATSGGTTSTGGTTSSGGTTSGGGTAVSMPTIADGAFKSGTTHVEISGGRNETFDVSTGGDVTTGGTTLLVFASSDNQRVVQMSFLPPGEADPGIFTTATTSGTAVGGALSGTWGKECQVKFTRNNASGLSGEFTCKDAAGLSGLVTMNANVKGTFSVER
jgi:hypothetical protein